jgi:uncharacterized SAM-binding protein YcdF (DUF218 family)
MKILKIIASLLLAWFLLVAFFICLMSSYFNQPTKADGVIVLGAAAYGNNPSPVFQARILTAINLYKSGLAKKIIFTGGSRNANDISEAKVAYNFAIKNGIAKADILFDEKSINTYQNLEEAKKIMTTKDMHSVLIVSDHFHLARAFMLSYKLDFPPVQVVPTTNSKIESLKNKSIFFAREFLLFQRDLFYAHSS